MILNQTDMYYRNLRALYDVERQQLQAFARMLAAATHPQLKSFIERLREETERQIARLLDLCSINDIDPQGESSMAMRGIVQEELESTRMLADVAARDMGLIGGLVRMKHYEEASYKMAILHAKSLDEAYAEDTLERSLAEERASGKQLLKLARDGAFSAGLNCARGIDSPC